MERLGGTILKALLRQHHLTTSSYQKLSVLATCHQESKKYSISHQLIRRVASHCHAHPWNKVGWMAFRREFSAIRKLLERSGISLSDQRSLLLRELHTSGSQANRPSSDASSSGGGGRSPGSSGGSGNKNDEEDQKKKNDEEGHKRRIITALLMTFMMYMFVKSGRPSSNQPEVSDSFVSWNEFVHMLSKGEVEEVIWAPGPEHFSQPFSSNPTVGTSPGMDIVIIKLKEGAIIKGKKMDQRIFHMNIVDIQHFEERLHEAESKLGIHPDLGVPVVYKRRWDIAGKLLLPIFLLAIIVLVSRNMNIKMKFEAFQAKYSPTRAKFTIIDPLLPGSGRGVKLSDVAGAKEAKQEVMEFVDFLTNPDKYRSLGAKIPKGALLLGPPGCGKTLLAKAVATEGQVPFLSMNGSEFIEMIGGLGAARVRDLFKEAKKRAPCIVYIDELDAVGRKRSVGDAHSGGEFEQTLNQLLVEMDGIGSKEGVVVLSSTNRQDILDKALLRPGRFDRHIFMDLPNLIERREIFEHHLKSIELEKPSSYYARRMASLTLGFSGADIANVVNEAALYAARHAKLKVTGEDLEYAVERVVGGTEKRSQAISPEERRVVAYHESGHALLGWLLEHTDMLLKVTIVPRTNQALGFAQYAPKDQKLYTQDQLFERMCMALGGRVAESLVFNRITTGAQNDLEKVTKMAYAQVRSFGFSDEVGHVSFPEEESRETGKRPYSKKLAATIDEEASKMIFAAYKKTEEVLMANMKQLTLLAEALLQKETLNFDDVQAILGPPPFKEKLAVEPLQFEWSIDSGKQAGGE